MRREYIFCSVIESPHIARRSPCRKSGPCGLGALSGLNWSKRMSFGCWANVGVRARVQATNPRSRIVFERIVLIGGILWLSQPWVKTRVQETRGAGARGGNLSLKNSIQPQMDGARQSHKQEWQSANGRWQIHGVLFRVDTAQGGWGICRNRREGKVWGWPSSIVTIKAARCGQDSISARPRCTPSRLTVVSRLSVVVASGAIMVA